MSTTSGTRSSVTFSMTSRTIDSVSSRSSFGHFEHELVVDGEEHPRAAAGFFQRVVELDHRELEHVGRRPLHRGVLRHALPHLADAEVVGRELGDLAPPAEDRGGVATLLRLTHRLGHVGLHVGEALEVGVEDLRRVAGGDVEALPEPVRLHPVRESVVDDLREPALRVVDGLLGHVEHGRGGGGVHVGAAFERVDQAGVFREVGEHAELDLRVVGGEETRSDVGDERAADLTTVGGADGDVLEVRRLARDAAGGGVGLLERGVDAAVGTDQRRERVGVGAPQLLHLSIAEQVFDDRVLLGHLLERVGVGRRPGLRLLHRDQAELLEEDRAELRRGVHVELLPRVGVDPMDEDVALLAEVGAAGCRGTRGRCGCRPTPSSTAPARAGARSARRDR